MGYLWIVPTRSLIYCSHTTTVVTEPRQWCWTGHRMLAGEGKMTKKTPPKLAESEMGRGGSLHMQNINSPKRGHNYLLWRCIQGHSSEKKERCSMQKKKVTSESVTDDRRQKSGAVRIGFGVRHSGFKFQPSPLTSWMNRGRKFKLSEPPFF